MPAPRARPARPLRERGGPGARENAAGPARRARRVSRGAARETEKLKSCEPGAARPGQVFRLPDSHPLIRRVSSGESYTSPLPGASCRALSTSAGSFNGPTNCRNSRASPYWLVCRLHSFWLGTTATEGSSEVFVRPGELRGARWEEFTFDLAESEPGEKSPHTEP